MRTVAALEGALGALSVSLTHANVETIGRGVGNDALERGLPLLDELLRAAGLAPRDLDALVCTTGPGGFTGLRITLTTAKTLALALEIPLVGVSTFDLIEELGEGTPTAGPRLAVLSPRPGILGARLRDARGATIFTGSGAGGAIGAALLEAARETPLAATSVYAWPSAARELLPEEALRAPVVAMRGVAPSSALLAIGARRLTARGEAPFASAEIHAIAAEYGEAVSVTPARPR